MSADRPLRKTQLFTTIADVITRWWSIVMAGVGGLITSYAASVTDALAWAAPLSWVVAGLGGALLTMLLLLTALKSAEVFTKWGVMRVIAATPPPVNPLDSTFQNRQVKLADLVMPFDRVLLKKRFIDCDLIGPGVVYLCGSANISNVGFLDCDFVVVRNGALVQNVLVLDSVMISGGRIFGATLLVPESQAEMMQKALPGLNWITR
jgi:hypothetical protein